MLNFADRIMSDNAKTSCEFCWLPIILEEFNLEIFPSDIYFLEKLPSEISFYSISIIFILSLVVSAIASYLPAMSISKMKTFRALKYE